MNVDNLKSHLMNSVEEKREFIEAVESFLEKENCEGADHLYEFGCALNGLGYEHEYLTKLVFDASAEAGNKLAKLHVFSQLIYSAQPPEQLTRCIKELFDLGSAGYEEAYDVLASFYQSDTEFTKADEEKSRLYRHLATLVRKKEKVAA